MITGNDVIHSWWVPDFGVKRDAVPGLFTSAWAKTDKPGTYVGECTELCGSGHAFMPVVVEVKEQADYDKWLADKKAEAVEYASTIGKQWTFDELMVRVKRFMTVLCWLSCGQWRRIPGVFPALKNSVIALGPVVEHLRVVVDGIPALPCSLLRISFQKLI